MKNDAEIIPIKRGVGLIGSTEPRVHTPLLKGKSKADEVADLAEKITRDSLDRTALHELLHVFLHDLITVAQDPKSSQDEVDMQEHRVVNLLENLLTRDSNEFK